ncbi:MAG: hypothetical protein N2318_03255 [Meiothermus sp.]|nr:hypothetical protein [Meiothermus sp.]
MMVAAILGWPAIYADCTLYWCDSPRSDRTPLARQLAEALGVPLVLVALMPPVERAALAAWGIRQIDHARTDRMTVEQWFALEDCRIRLWQVEREAYGCLHA